jgi:hypothetical protein
MGDSRVSERRGYRSALAFLGTLGEVPADRPVLLDVCSQGSSSPRGAISEVTRVGSVVILYCRHSEDDVPDDEPETDEGATEGIEQYGRGMRWVARQAMTAGQLCDQIRGLIDGGDWAHVRVGVGTSDLSLGEQLNTQLGDSRMSFLASLEDITLVRLGVAGGLWMDVCTDESATYLIQE